MNPDTTDTYETPPPADSYTDSAPDHCDPHRHGERGATEGRRCRDCGGPLR